MKLVANRNADQLLIEQMLAPPPLEQARSSLEFWRRRRGGLSFFRVRERKEADEMIRRWRARVAAAERARFGTGLVGQVRRLLSLEPLSWPFGRKGELVVLVWRMLPRPVAVVAVAAFAAVLITLVAIGLGAVMLVLQVT